MNHSCTRRAFTLLELAIVIAIIGLIAGGIAIGQNLIRASELRSVLSNKDKYFTAINTFEDKYGYLPGDIPNATEIWGTAGGNGIDGACRSAEATINSRATCNGNGNGEIANGVSNVVNERFRVWKHLANAGLIDGSYFNIGNTNYQNGVSAPSSKLKNTLWGFCHMSYDTGLPMVARLVLGRPGWGSNYCGVGTQADLSPEEASNIDSKADDGWPGRGEIHAMDGVTTSSGTQYWQCVTASLPWTANWSVYILTETGKHCRMFFQY